MSYNKLTKHKQIYIDCEYIFTILLPQGLIEGEYITIDLDPLRDVKFI